MQRSIKRLDDLPKLKPRCGRPHTHVPPANVSSVPSAAATDQPKEFRSYLGGPCISSIGRPLSSSAIQAQRQFSLLLDSREYNNVLKDVICKGPQTQSILRHESNPYVLWDIVERGVFESVKDAVIYDRLREAFHSKARAKQPSKTPSSSNRIKPHVAASRRANDVATAIHDVMGGGGSFKPSAYLDIGCDDGLNTKAVGERLGLSHPLIHGCDVTDKTVPADVVYHKYNGIDLQFPAQSFDVVTALMSLHHIHNPEAVIAGIFRTLKPGGVLVIREHECATDERRMLLDIVHGLYSLVWSNPKEWPEFCEEAMHGFRSRDEWRKMVMRCGFRVCNSAFCETSFHSHAKEPMAVYWDVFQKPADNSSRQMSPERELPERRADVYTAGECKVFLKTCISEQDRVVGMSALYSMNGRVITSVRDCQALLHGLEELSDDTPIKLVLEELNDSTSS
jgi:SAM-dependent methyltransferase